MEIIWKPLKFKEKIFNEYEVSNEGNIRRHTAKFGRTSVGKILKPSMAGGRVGHGYAQVVLCVNGVHTNCRIHRAVMETFIGSPKDFEVNHIDGDKFNNKLLNLEYCMRQQNVAHAVATKLMDRRGSKHPMAKLKEVDVIEIKKLLNQGNLSQSAIGRQFNISSKAIWKIKHGIRWGHLEIPTD